MLKEIVITSVDEEEVVAAEAIIEDLGDRIEELEAGIEELQEDEQELIAIQNGESAPLSVPDETEQGAGEVEQPTAEAPVAEAAEEPEAETVEEPVAETVEEPVAETVEETVT